MSTRHIPYPPDFDIDQAAAHHEERRRRALAALDVGDVLASEPDPVKHPLYPMDLWLLDQALTPGDGGTFWDQWKALVLQAIDALVDDALAMED